MADVATIVVAAVFLVVTTPVAFISLYMVVRLRNAFPMTGRDVRILVAFWVSITISAYFVPLSSLFETNCHLYLVFALNVQAIGVNAVLVMMFRLWFMYFAAQHQLMKYLNPKKPYCTWFAERRHYASSKFLLRVFLVVTSVEVLLGDVWFALGLPIIDSGHTVFSRIAVCPSLGTPIVIANTLLGGTFLVVLLTGWRIRQIRDGYAMREELKYMTISGVFFVVAIALEGRIPMIMSVILSGISNLLTYSVNFLYPVGLALREKRAQSKRRKKRGVRKLPASAARSSSFSSKSRGAQQSTSDSDRLTLREILTNEIYNDLREDFANHLAKEFSTENLLFWNEAGEFYDQYDERTAHQTMLFAIRIYDDYVDATAPFQANLDSKTRTALSEEIARCPVEVRRGGGNYSSAASEAADIRFDREMFEDAREKVYMLMARDSYVRWVSHRHDACKDAEQRRKVAAAAAAASSQAASSAKTPRTNDEEDAADSENSSGSYLDDTWTTQMSTSVFLPANISQQLESAGLFEKKEVIEAFSLTPSPKKHFSLSHAIRGSTPLSFSGYRLRSDIAPTASPSPSLQMSSPSANKPLPHTPMPRGGPRKSTPLVSRTRLHSRKLSTPLILHLFTSNHASRSNSPQLHRPSIDQASTNLGTNHRPSIESTSASSSSRSLLTQRNSASSSSRSLLTQRASASSSSRSLLTQLASSTRSLPLKPMPHVFTSNASLETSTSLDGSSRHLPPILPGEPHKPLSQKEQLSSSHTSCKGPPQLDIVIEPQCKSPPAASSSASSIASQTAPRKPSPPTVLPPKSTVVSRKLLSSTSMAFVDSLTPFYYTSQGNHGRPPASVSPADPVKTTPKTPMPRTPMPQTPMSQTPMPQTPMPQTPKLQTPIPQTPVSRVDTSNFFTLKQSTAASPAHRRSPALPPILHVNEIKPLPPTPVSVTDPDKPLPPTLVLSTEPPRKPLPPTPVVSIECRKPLPPTPVVPAELRRPLPLGQHKSVGYVTEV